MKKNVKKSGKTNIKRLSGVALSVLLVGGLIAGCGKSAGASADITTGVQAEAGTTVVQQTTEAAKDKVTVKNDAETKSNAETTAAQKETVTTTTSEATTTAAKESVTEAPKKPSVTNNSTPAKQEATTAAAVDNTPADTPNTPEKPQPTEAPTQAPKPIEKPTEKQTEAATEQPTETPQPTEAPTQAPAHVHSWAERVIGERIVVDRPAWDEQIEVLPERDEQVAVGSYLVCNTCGDPWPCSDELHGGSHTERIYETVHKPAEYRTVHHDAETHKENITETYCTSCGEIR